MAGRGLEKAYKGQPMKQHTSLVLYLPLITDKQHKNIDCPCIQTTSPHNSTETLLLTCMQAHCIPVQMARAGSVLSISGMGRWLDKGLHKLMGGPEQPPASQGAAADTAGVEFDPYIARHRRNTSDQLLTADTPKVRIQPPALLDTKENFKRSDEFTPTLLGTAQEQEQWPAPDG